MEISFNKENDTNSFTTFNIHGIHACTLLFIKPSFLKKKKKKICTFYFLPNATEPDKKTMLFYFSL